MEEINKIVSRDETDSKEVKSSDTLTLSNPPTPDESLRLTHLNIGERRFFDFDVVDVGESGSVISPSEDADIPFKNFSLRVVKDKDDIPNPKRAIRKIIDYRGNEFPGTEFEELQVTDESLILKDSEGDFSEILKVSPDGHFSESTIRNFISSVGGVLHWTWEKF